MSKHRADVRPTDLSATKFFLTRITFHFFAFSFWLDPVSKSSEQSGNFTLADFQVRVLPSSVYYCYYKLEARETSHPRKGELLCAQVSTIHGGFSECVQA